MKIEKLSTNRLEDFKMYCKKHRREIDESFLYDEDLDVFEISEEQPTYIAIDEEGRVVGTASLIMDNYAKRGRKSRFRIFHSELTEKLVYQSLMDKLLPYHEGFDKYFVFVPLVNTQLEGVIKNMGFEVERFAYYLLREDIDVPESTFPEGFEVLPFRLGIDEEAWCEVRNAGFAKLRGSETPLTPEEVHKTMQSKDVLPDGAMILYNQRRPIGIVKCSADEYEGKPAMDIGPLALIPEYQGKGLGRLLLRKAIQLGKDQSYKQTVLSVNAENERAKSLYLQEGFKEVESVACYAYYFNKG